MRELDVPEDVWAPLVQRFAHHYESLFGQVRLYVLREQLRWHVARPPAAVVDVGGGAGHQAIPLAREGYDVTLLDPSAEMLDHARARLEAEDREVTGRVRLVEADGERAVEVLAGQGFDAVLCHGVLPYLDDPAPVVSALVGLARRGGVVSVVAKNARTLAMRAAMDRDWEDVLAAFDATREVNRLGLDTRAETPEELSFLFADHGVTTVAWYGVRLFTEGWGRDCSAAGVEDSVFAAELEASRRDPYRQLSRLFHLVGTKTAHSRAEHPTCA
jgi:2-polyprenyl-3-methyl-5-hydroxy-6-metoxy-1,4-benzoquinol methylase